jgi:hypothetical protein
MERGTFHSAARDAIDITLAALHSIAAEEKPERLDLQPAVAHARWVRPIGD